MSGQRWIDEFFRRRMERRTFPVEKGELEEVRALLAKRNEVADVVRVGGISKWWLSALIPVAGLLWWTVGERSSGSEEDLPATGQHEVINGQYDSEQETRAEKDAIAHVEADPSLTEDEVGFDDHNGTAASLGSRTALENDPYARSRTGDARSAKGSGTSRPGPDGVMDTLDPGSVNAPAEDAYGTLRSDRREERQDAASMNAQPGDKDGTSRSGQPGTRPDQVRMNVHVDDEHAGSPGIPIAPLLDQSGVNNPADDHDHSPVSEDLDLLSVRSATDAVELIQPRWSMQMVAGAPEPLRRDVPEFKRMPTGELHFFGAPLLVRTRSSGGGRSGTEPGSLVGLEYRVRSGRISWATGIRYGSYTLKADQGATDVTLSFVELPLLAIVQQGWGRFGASVQGGLSVDLLFNASGRYPLGDRSVTVFPESAFRTANFSWSLRPQAIYRVNEHLSVSAGPLWKAQIGEVAKEGPLDGAKISSAGLSIGVTWRLERSTF